MSQSFYVLAFSRIAVRVVAPDKQNKPLYLSLLLADEGIVDYTSFKNIYNTLMEMKNCNVTQ